MRTEPSVEQRTAQAYVGAKASVTMQTIPEIADRIPEIFGWLAEHGAGPSGAPFLKYDVIDMERRLEIEAGVPIASGVTGDDRFFAGTLPAGRYLTVTHVGHPDELIDVTADLLEWATEQGLDFDMTDTPDGQRWGCRLETYRTDPAEEPDVSKWETELAFRLADWAG